jgi:glycosyltransferase involved in cell wall biosynthesis
MNRTRFSIIIPTYNRGYILWKTILGVQKQIYPDWELLIVDNASTDNTKQIVAEFQKDLRIKYFQINKRGGQIARNFGLEQATGSIITYIDSDDYVYENFLSTALEYFTKYPKIVFAIPNYNRRIELYDEDYKLVDFTNVSSSQKENITIQDYFHWNVKTCGTGIFHKENIIKDEIRWDTTIKRFQDWDFILQLGTKYPKGFMHIPFVLFEYLQKYGGDSMCSKASYQDWADGFDVIYQKHKNSPLMKGQEWYPDRIEKYTELQKKVESGEIPEAIYKFFPDLGKVKHS